MREIRGAPIFAGILAFHRRDRHYSLIRGAVRGLVSLFLFLFFSEPLSCNGNTNSPVEKPPQSHSAQLI